MNWPRSRYSAEDVLAHVDDPDRFLDEFAAARRRRDAARAAFVADLTPEVKAEWIGGEADVAVWSKADHRFTPELLLYPPAGLVVEVLSESTASADRKTKFVNYAKAGVHEYWIVDADTGVVEQYFNRDGAFVPQGICRGDDRVALRAVAGFEVPAAALFEQAAFANTLRALAAGT